MNPAVLIVGGGFGGLYAAKALAQHPVQVTIVDRKNHHTFQPLLYQVATAALSPAEIAVPIRREFRRRRNVEVLLGEVAGLDVQHQFAQLGDGLQLPYDYLIVATGATHHYFGHDEWARYAPGLKTVEDALEIRRRVLLAFEVAEKQAAIGVPLQPLNLVVIGGGPTGVELAGTLAEVSRRALAQDFRHIDPKQTRVLLFEAGPRVLPSYPERLSQKAEQQLRNLGVEVHANAMVTSVECDSVRVAGQQIPSAVTLWAAGVAASPLGALLGVPLDKAGRVIVEKDLSIPDHPNLFVIGDLASCRDAEGKLVPGVAPAAIQEGRAVAANIMRDLAGRPRQPFRYEDKGNLATIGRAAAVADLGRLRLSGFVAWMAWLFVHIYFLIGFRNRLFVLLEWAWAYFTYDRQARLITGNIELPWHERAKDSTPRPKRAA